MMNDDDELGAGDGASPTDPPTEETSGGSVSERTASGEHLRPAEPPEPPLRGDAQLTLNVGALIPAKARTIERAFVNIAAVRQEVDGLFKPDQRYPFLVFGVPGDVREHFIRDPKSTEVPKRVRAIEQTQTVTPDALKRADTPEAVYDLYSALLDNSPEEAGALLERLQSLTSETLAVAAA